MTLDVIGACLPQGRQHRGAFDHGYYRQLAQSLKLLDNGVQLVPLGWVLLQRAYLAAVELDEIDGDVPERLK